ncbi:unnamed protein product [Oikopleura dioica]|uniref:Prolyl endopeptidase n=1 Tax=Oikopleura dioica TaxID=34765 RepID=E4XW44_OIKDI|nr:unnamed protein product [Oikopleura dioica]
MALDEKPFKLGRIYCTNRPIAIYKTSISDFSKFEKLTDIEYSARSPRWIPGNDESFIFLKRTTYGPHLECDALCKFTDGKIQEIIPVVKDYPKTATEFAGIYCTELKSSPFLILPSDEPLLLQSTITKSSVIVFAISMSGEIQRITEPGKSSYVSSICGNSAAIISCSENTSESVHILQMKSATDFSLEEVVTASDSFERVHENFELVSKSKRTFESHFTGKSGNKNLALYPHGGPNSNVTKSFSTTFIGLGELGYDILMPNYTGSVGYGQDNVYSLGGNIGDYDIADCLDALDHHLKTSKNSYENVFVFGGSHGGFLTAHLTAARPDQFRAAVIRNPVIDLNSMHHVTDIPDWNEWQGLNIPPLLGKPPSEEQILELRKRSPIAYAHKVKTPTLMNIGLKDLRVPPPQGDQWIKALRSYGVSCEQYDYPEDCHPLGSTETLGDIFVHLHRWFDMHKQ